MVSGGNLSCVWRSYASQQGGVTGSIVEVLITHCGGAYHTLWVSQQLYMQSLTHTQAGMGLKLEHLEMINATSSASLI